MCRKYRRKNGDTENISCHSVLLPPDSRGCVDGHVNYVGPAFDAVLEPRPYVVQRKGTIVLWIIVDVQSMFPGGVLCDTEQTVRL